MTPSESRSLAATYRRYIAAIVVYHHQAAAYLGLGATDFQAANLLFLNGPMRAGELARATGLSKGATTRMIDRLAERGYVERSSDGSDGRSVSIRLADRMPDDFTATLADVRARVGALMQPLSPDELRVLSSYFVDAASAYQEATERLRLSIPPPDRG